MLGAAVVKTACKIWLRDHAIAADAAVGVVEIIQAKVGDAREQRRVRRLFEDLEERVADNVLTGMDVEFARVPEHERDATVLAVADTFDQARLTTGDLFAANLAAPRLLRMMRPLTRRHTRDLSADATALYDRVLAECCAYIVEVADALPGFQVGVFGELLTRQHEILRHVDERFDRLPMQLGGAGAETFEPTYLRLVAKQLDKVELFGVTVSDRVGSYPLSVAYVSLSISATARQFADQPERRVTSIEDGLSGTRRAFIRGEAGSGKTTLLQWLAVRCARRELTGPMRDWAGSVPLFIRLRRYSGAELPPPEEFLREVGRNIAQTMPLGWVNGLLAAGRAAVLVDGVDELPEAQRRRAREWLRELVMTYPDARYVVTSRPAAAEESWLSSDGFDVLEIQPMTISDIDAFVSHWHAAMADGVTEPKEIERLDASRQELPKTIRTHRHLRMLAVNPLMTALICALHLDRRMQLPNDRMELYSIALEMLLERRDTEREIASSLSISRADKVLILEDLAYWLVRNGWSNASRDRVLERLAAKLSSLHRVQGSPEEVLEHLLTRSGLLRMPVEGQIDFVHKTFQEFLAARAAVAADDIGVLVNHAEDDQWREVILMAAACARATQTDELLRKILDRATHEPEHQYLLQVLAIASSQQAPEVDRGLKEGLEDLAVSLLPPREMDQAKALARAGDLVLEQLSTWQDFRRTEAIATIHMAALIGGDEAMSIIARCAKSNTGREVEDQLEQAWLKFDAEEFAVRVLRNFQFSVRALRVYEPPQLAGAKLLGISNLFCSFAHGHGDVAFLADMPQLTYLGLFDPALRDIVPVAAHPNLNSLALFKGCGRVDLAPVGDSATMRRLLLSYQSIVVESLREVQVPRIEFFDCEHPNQVLPHLAPDRSLEGFVLWRANNISDLAELIDAPQLAQLRGLGLGDAYAMLKIEGIEHWAETLRNVELAAPGLVDVEQLAALPLLSTADLRGTPVLSLEFFRSSSMLSRLEIGGPQAVVPDLAPLSDLPSLRTLRIYGDHKFDISGLARAGELSVEIEGEPDRVIGLEKVSSSVEVRFGLEP